MHPATASACYACKHLNICIQYMLHTSLGSVHYDVEGAAGRGVVLCSHASLPRSEHAQYMRLCVFTARGERELEKRLVFKS